MYPDDLLNSLPALEAPADRVWWAVYTRSRQERAVARELFRCEVPFYLPLIPSDRVVNGRRIRSFLPLFAGYIFVFGTDDERIMTLKTNRISKILPVTDQERLCPNSLSNICNTHENHVNPVAASVCADRSNMILMSVADV